MSDDLSRRKFLEKLGLGAATGASAWLLKDVAQAEAPPTALPTRTLGRTGAKVSMITGETTVVGLLPGAGIGAAQL